MILALYPILFVQLVHPHQQKSVISLGNLCLISFRFYRVKSQEILYFNFARRLKADVHALLCICTQIYRYMQCPMSDRCFQVSSQQSHDAHDEHDDQTMIGKKMMSKYLHHLYRHI